MWYRLLESFPTNLKHIFALLFDMNNVYVRMSSDGQTEVIS